MRASPSRLLRELSVLASAPTSESAADAQLLERFIVLRDEASFAVLVSRHGPMVLRLCRRVMGNGHDAEDAFQATFLVLARKAAAIRRRHHLAAWLHGTAYRIALKARAALARRRQAEFAMPATKAADRQPDPLSQISARELLTALDEELARLPEVFRQPLVLCFLEGRTQEEAARQLGWTPGSVKGRLERGRARLHSRLARRGLDLSAGLLALEALHGPAAAGVAGVLLWSTAQAAVRFAAGAGSATGGAAPALTLAEGVLKTMLLSKIKIATALVMFAAALVAGGGLFVFGTRAGEGSEGPAAKAPAPPAPQARKPEEKKAATDRDLLQGTWVAVAGEQDGRPWEVAWVKQTEQKLTIEGDRYTLRSGGDENYQTGTFTLNPKRKPKQIDFTETSIRPRWVRNKFGPFPVAGIYELTGETLKLSRVGGRGNARPTDFTTAPKSLRVVIVFRRADGGPNQDAPAAGKPEEKKAAADSDKLQGTWVAVVLEQNGRAQPAEVRKRFQLTIEGNRFTMGQELALHFPHGTFTLDPGAQPKAIDFMQTYGLPGEKPVRLRGIYELDGGRVERWRGGLGKPCVLPALSVAGARVAPHAPSPPPAHRTGRADLPHPALGQGLTPTHARSQQQYAGAGAAPGPCTGNGPRSVTILTPVPGASAPATCGAYSRRGLSPCDRPP
jgi:RNA polymerase sigma factor (sigma-70 family)